MNRAQQQRYGLYLPLICAIAGTIALWGPWTAQLPDPIAIHWGLDGKGGNCIPFSWFRGLCCPLILALSARQAQLFGIWGAQPPRAPQRSHVSNTGLLCVISLAAIATMYNNYGASSCRASSLSWPFLALVISVPLLITRKLSALVQTGAVEKGPSMGLDPQDQAVWVQSESSPLILGIGILSGLVTCLLGPLDAWTTWLVACASLAACLCLGWIRVHAGPRGCEVFYGPLPFALTRISLAEIRCARVETMSPGQSGGWGYRGILSLTGRATVFLRSGEGLVLELTQGRQFRVTVDDAHRAAGLLNDLIARRAQ